MKLKLLIASLMCVAVILFIWSESGYALDPKDAVAYWDFEDGAGTTVTDISGHGHDGKIVGKLEWVKDGKYGGGLKFDGVVNNVVEVPNHADLQITEDITMEGWVFPTSANQGHVVGKENSWGMPLWNNLEVKWVIWGADWFTGVGPKVNEWTHIALVYDYSGDKQRYIYINGEQKGKQATSIKMPVSNNPVTMGQWDTLTGQEKLIGVIDNVAIWKRPLSAAEVKEAMSPTTAVMPEDKLPVTWGNLKHQLAIGR
jgi:hypothetical protein